MKQLKSLNQQYNIILMCPLKSSTAVYSKSSSLNRVDINLVDYAIEMSREHTSSTSKDVRKKIGQFFTPKETAVFMGSFININKSELSLLDPGAGTGNLLSAVCQKIFEEALSPINVRIDAFECDLSVIPYLQKVLELCRDTLESKGHNLQYNILKEDFISYNQDYLCKNNLKQRNELFYYDAVISNPPYYKLNKDSPQATIMGNFISGQPNIYSLFMTLSAHMIKDGGDIVFITPRSFCSGLYYKKVRDWFIKNTCINWIHNFESRKNQFVCDDILQENVILHTIRTKDNCPPFNISSSYDNRFEDYKELEVTYDDLIFNRTGEEFIRVPSSATELDVIKVVDSWDHTLRDFGLKMSTGPVVDFRTKENLRENCVEEDNAPLIWMQNLERERINWPIDGLKKPQGIEVNTSTKKILLPIKNYILVKRFTSKEQKRRISVTPFLENEFREYSGVGFENHLNYIHRPRGELSLDEVFGLTALLNTRLMDLFFRALNGNTQVNATEINILPIPHIDLISKIGAQYQAIENKSAINLDEFVGDFLGLDSDLIKRLI